MEHPGSILANDCVLDLSELTEVSIIKTLGKGVKVMTDRHKKYSQKNKDQFKYK